MDAMQQMERGHNHLQTVNKCVFLLKISTQVFPTIQVVLVLSPIMQLRTIYIYYRSMDGHGLRGLQDEGQVLQIPLGEG